MFKENLKLCVIDPEMTGGGAGKKSESETARLERINAELVMGKQIGTEDRAYVMSLYAPEYKGENMDIIRFCASKIICVDIPTLQQTYGEKQWDMIRAAKAN